MNMNKTSNKFVCCHNGHNTSCDFYVEINPGSKFYNLCYVTWRRYGNRSGTELFCFIVVCFVRDNNAVETLHVH